MVFIVVFVTPGSVIIYGTAFTRKDEIQSTVGIVTNSGIKDLFSKNYLKATFSYPILIHLEAIDTF
tara:strand:+ start:320 stop:517 length:198 start_codon:yes stop_codon:yes gene_type:complete